MAKVSVKQPSDKLPRIIVISVIALLFIITALNAPQPKIETTRAVVDNETGISFTLPKCDDYQTHNTPDKGGYMMGYLCKNNTSRQGFSVFITTSNVFNAKDDDSAYLALETEWFNYPTFKVTTKNRTKFLDYPAIEYTGQQTVDKKAYDAMGKVIYLTDRNTLVDLIYYGNSIQKTVYNQFVDSLKINN